MVRWPSGRPGRSAPPAARRAVGAGKGVAEPAAAVARRAAAAPATRPAAGGQLVAEEGGAMSGAAVVPLGFDTGISGDHCVRDVQMQAQSLWHCGRGDEHVEHDRAAANLRAAGAGGWRQVGRAHVGRLATRRARSDVAALDDGYARRRPRARRSYSFFVPASDVSASRRLMTSAPLADQHLQAWALETLASMTGGASFRVPVGADGPFDRLTRELTGYYRLGVERAPEDRDGKGRPLKVQVAPRECHRAGPRRLRHAHLRRPRLERAAACRARLTGAGHGGRPEAHELCRGRPR